MKKMCNKSFLCAVFLVIVMASLCVEVLATVLPPCPTCEGGINCRRWYCPNGQVCCNKNCCTNSCCYGTCYDGVTHYCCGPGKVCSNSDGCCDGKACFDDETKHCCYFGDGKTCNNNESCCSGTQGKDCCNNEYETCCDGKCCDAGEVCCDGQCTGACYLPEWVDEVFIPCDDCQTFSGCLGDSRLIPGRYIWRSAISGESGYCEMPEKDEAIVQVLDCTEDWDAWKLLECAAKAAACEATCNSGSWVACLACLVLHVPGCVGLPPCTFVIECVPDATNVQYTEITVVDWSSLGAVSICSRK